MYLVHAEANIDVHFTTLKVFWQIWVPTVSLVLANGQIDVHMSSELGRVIVTLNNWIMSSFGIRFFH